MGRRDVAFWRGLARRASAAARWSSAAARAACCCRWRAPACRSSASIDPSRCWRAARARLRRSRTPRVGGAGPRRHPRAAVRRGRAVRSGGRALRHPAVAGARRDLSRTLASVARVLAPGGVFGIDLVPDVPNWREYSRRVTLRGQRGPRGVPITLVESVRQDRARRLTVFDQEFTEGWGRAAHGPPLLAGLPHRRRAGAPPPPRARRLRGRRRARRLRRRALGSARRHLGGARAQAW